jgi:Tfp pilus assembly protein PilV
MSSLPLKNTVRIRNGSAIAGLSIIEVLIAAAVLAIAIAFVTPIRLGRENRVNNNNAVTSLVALRTNLASLLADPGTWSNLKNDTTGCGSTLTCVSTAPYDCTAALAQITATGNPIAIPCVNYITGLPLINNSDPNFGFGLDETTCDAFSPTGLSPPCPFRYSLTWAPLCVAGVAAGLPGSCISSPIQITGVLQTALRSGAVNSPSVFDFIVRH